MIHDDDDDGDGDYYSNYYSVMIIILIMIIMMKMMILRVMMMHDSNDVSMSIHVWHHIEIHKHLVAHDEGLVEEEEQQLVEVISPRILVDQVPRELSHSAVEQGR